jgi:hypothetical protein
VNDLAHRFEHRLFLPATPRNGHSNSFSALLEMLEPQRFTRGVQRFARGVEVRPRDLEPVMVRRLKSDLRRLGEAFPERTVERISIAGLPKDAPELDLWQKLADYGKLRSRRVGKLHLCACERNSLKQFTKEAETARSPYNRSVIGAPIGETQRLRSGAPGRTAAPARPAAMIGWPRVMNSRREVIRSPRRRGRAALAAR